MESIPYDILVKGLGVGIMVQDPRGVFIFVNEHAATMSGFSDAAAMLAADPATLLKRFSCFDRDGTPLSADQMPGRIVLAGGRANHALIRYRNETTSQYGWANLHASPINDAHGAIRYVVTHRQSDKG